MANSKAMCELQSYINRGRKEERESIAKSLLEEAKELTVRAERAGAYKKYEEAGRYIEQANRLRGIALSIRNMPKTW